MKAALSVDGEGGYCYYDLKPFSTRELQKHFVFYLLNSLDNSPRVEQKFKPQSRDQFHGNDLIYHVFGLSAKRRYRHFKTFLAILYPAISTASREKYHNWKVRPLVQ